VPLVPRHRFKRFFWLGGLHAHRSFEEQRKRDKVLLCFSRQYFVRTGGIPAIQTSLIPGSLTLEGFCFEGLNSRISVVYVSFHRVDGANIPRQYNTETCARFSLSIILFLSTWSDSCVKTVFSH
jgi:hypothetical protein